MKGIDITLAVCVKRVEDRLASANLFFGHGTDNAFDEAVWLVSSAIDVDITSKALDWSQTLNDGDQLSVKQLLEARIATCKPLAYLVKHAWFAGHKFYIDERTIVPRSHFSEWITDRFKPWIGKPPVKTVLDLCTGSGCLAVSIAFAFPEATIDATDISEDALDVAAINIETHAMDGRIQLLRGDLFDAIESKSRYDLIVCNPPYVEDQSIESLPAEYSYEPRIALAGGCDGLDFVSRVFAMASQYLKQTGRLFMEVGSLATVIEETWPVIPFTWLSSSSGELTVLTLTTRELIKYAPHFERR